MFLQMIKIINRQLGLRILIPLTGIVGMIMAAIIGYNVMEQEKNGQSSLAEYNAGLLAAVSGGIQEPLARGDNEAVRAQLRLLGGRTRDLKVFVYNFDGRISFGSGKETEGQTMTQVVDGPVVQDLRTMLGTGKASDRSFDVVIDREPYLMENRPILNNSSCAGCHGTDRPVLGGISMAVSRKSVLDAASRSAKVGVGIGFVGLTLIFMFFRLFFHFLVNKKVRMVLNAMARMRQKDFSIIEPIREGDEINHILARINLVTLDLRQTFVQFRDHSGSLFTSAADLGRIADTLTSASTDASCKAVAVSASAEQMNSGHQSMAASMEQTTHNFNAMASAMEQMTATVGEIAKNVHATKDVIAQVADSFEMIHTAVRDLGQRADDVDGVTDQIRSIAEQVGMLALNAKIEAARAGQAGKGFAVVAQEITDLAQETNRSTLQADEKLRWIKDKSLEVLEKVTGLTSLVRDSDQAISNISAAVEEQNVTTREMARNIHDVSSELSDVNSHVGRGAAAASDIAREITAVEDGARKVQESSRQLNESARTLSHMAEQLTALIRQFKV